MWNDVKATWRWWREARRLNKVMKRYAKKYFTARRNHQGHEALAYYAQMMAARATYLEHLEQNPLTY